MTSDSAANIELHSKSGANLANVAWPQQGTHGYTPEQRMHTALAWVITGTTAGASKVARVPERTICDWRKEEWWEQAIQEARRVKQEELDAKLSGIIDLSLKRLTDMLDGDDPIPLNQIAICMAIAYDKRALMRGDPTSRSERVDPSARLAVLKAEFSKIRDLPADAELSPPSQATNKP